MSPAARLAGERVFLAGTLVTMSREAARRIIERAGGRLAPDLDERTSLVVLGAADPEAARQSIANLPAASPRDPRLAPRVIDEDEWCRLVGRVGPTALQQQYYPLRTVRSLYPRVRADHLRYLERWGLLRAIVRTPDDTWYGFRDVAVIRQAHAELERGGAFRSVLRTLAAETDGQLSLDFRPPRGDNQPARVLTLAARQAPSGSAPLFDVAPRIERTPAEMKFLEASALDADGQVDREAAMLAYRTALELDPDLVPAMINLGNLHYLQDRLAEAQALYLQASIVDHECFEAWFNLGNVHHDRGRLEEAAQCYAEALRLAPGYANAHFYLAVTLEKLGRAPQAKPHWRAYQQLAPQGEWIDLAREFGE
jgi:tetratricopeptide (TPR) repeat protein